jgi:hypothetical protein
MTRANQPRVLITQDCRCPTGTSRSPIARVRFQEGRSDRMKTICAVVVPLVGTRLDSVNGPRHPWMILPDRCIRAGTTAGHQPRGGLAVEPHRTF